MVHFHTHKFSYLSPNHPKPFLSPYKMISWAQKYPKPIAFHFQNMTPHIYTFSLSLIRKKYLYTIINIIEKTFNNCIKHCWNDPCSF